MLRCMLWAACLGLGACGTRARCRRSRGRDWGGRKRSAGAEIGGGKRWGVTGRVKNGNEGEGD